MWLRLLAKCKNRFTLENLHNEKTSETNACVILLNLIQRVTPIYFSFLYRLLMAKLDSKLILG